MSDSSAPGAANGPPRDGRPAGPPNYGRGPNGPPNYGIPNYGPPNYGPQYSGRPRHYPALQGAAPVSPGLQIAARLVEALIISIPVVLLSALAVVPFLVAIFAAAGYDTDGVRGGANGNVDVGDAGVIIAAFLTTAGVILLIWLLIALALVWWLGVKGGSIGNAIFGLRLVSTDTGQPIGWGKALLWYVVVIVGTAVTGGILGLLFVLSPLFDNTSEWSQSWQDKMVGAVLINTRMGRNTITGTPGPYA